MPEHSTVLPGLLRTIGKRLAILVVGPMLVIVTLLLLLAQGIHQYPLAVCNEDQGFDMPMAGYLNIPETLVKALDPNAFAITTVATPAEARALYDAGKVKALLLFPPHLTEDIFIKQDDPSYEMPAKIDLRLAETNPLARLFVVGTIGRNALGALQAGGQGPSFDNLPVPLDVQPLLDGFVKAPSYVLLAMLAFIAWVITGLMALSAARELRGTGIGAMEQLGFIVAFALAGWVFYLGVCWLGSLIVSLALPAGFLAGATAVLLLLACSAALAFTAGYAAPKEEASRAAIPFLILPLFFAGFLFPVELMPAWLQWFAWLLPPHYGLPAVLAIQLDTPMSGLAANLIATAAWLLGFWGLGLAGLKRRAAALQGAEK